VYESIQDIVMQTALQEIAEEAEIETAEPVKSVKEATESATDMNIEINVADAGVTEAVSSNDDDADAIDEAATVNESKFDAEMIRNMNVVELKAFIDEHELDISKQIGGKKKRTKTDIVNEILAKLNL